MSFSINTNISAVTANLNSNTNLQVMNKSLNSLSSALKLNNASDDASSMMIANELSSQVRGMGQSIMNANDSIGIIQIAGGALQGVSENMDRIRELTLKASNGTMNSSNRASIQKEIDALMRSSSDIVNQTSYNGMNLFGGASPISGKAEGFSLTNSIDVTSSQGLALALDQVDSIKSNINEVHSDLGSRQNQLMSEVRNTSVSQINAASAESQLRDIDFAAESANFSQANLKSQIGSFAQSQANAQASSVARLFG